MDDSRQTILPEPLKNLVLGALDPVADRLIRAGLTPNGITTVSALVQLLSGVLFGIGALRWGAAVLLLHGILDLLDGKVARRGGMTTEFGAFYDSTLDRLGDAWLFMGIGVHFVITPGQRWPILGLLLCFFTLTFSFLVSYARARAEGLGLDGRVGIAQRAERIVLIGVPVLIWQAGPGGWLLLGVLAFLCVTSLITAVQRAMHVRRQVMNRHAAQGAPNARDGQPASGPPVRRSAGPSPHPVVKGT